MYAPGWLAMVPVVGTYQLLAALVPFKTVLKLYVIDADVPTILGMPVSSNCLSTNWLVKA